MNEIILVLQIVILAGIGCIFLFRKFLFSYSAEKGKNLATKEDVEEITKKVESVRSEYLQKLEILKAELYFLSKKNSILFDEKIRVFKKLQITLVNFKKYCEASWGAYGTVSEFQPHLETLSKDIVQATLHHITELHETEQEDFIFLSGKSRNSILTLIDECKMMCNMEIALIGNEDDQKLVESIAPSYLSTIELIDECLLNLYQELEFPLEQ